MKKKVSDLCGTVNAQFLEFVNLCLKNVDFSVYFMGHPLGTIHKSSLFSQWMEVDAMSHHVRIFFILGCTS